MLGVLQYRIALLQHVAAVLDIAFLTVLDGSADGLYDRIVLHELLVIVPIGRFLVLVLIVPVFLTVPVLFVLFAFLPLFLRLVLAIILGAAADVLEDAELIAVHLGEPVEDFRPPPGIDPAHQRADDLRQFVLSLRPEALIAALQSRQLHIAFLGDLILQIQAEEVPQLLIIIPVHAFAFG